MSSPPTDDANSGSARRAFRRARRNLSPNEQRSHAAAVVRHVATSGLLNLSGSIGLYLANDRDGELDTGPLLTRLWAMGKVVACPVTDRGPVTARGPVKDRGPVAEGHPVTSSGGGTMSFYRLGPTTAIVSARYELAEPRTFGADAGAYLPPLALTLLFAPLVAFDNQGQRIGMGAGYYDRYLGSLAPSLRPLVIGLAHEVQRSSASFDAEPWDIPLDGVVTERGWQPFSSRVSRFRKPG